MSELKQLRDELAEVKRKLTDSESQVDALSNLLANASDTLRSRGFTGPKQFDERVIAMAQSNDQLHAETERLRKENEALENSIDEQWLSSIAQHWNECMGKPWDTKDGETTEEGRQANVAALFTIIEALMAVAKAASVIGKYGPNLSPALGDYESLYKTLTAAREAGVKI